MLSQTERRHNLIEFIDNISFYERNNFGLRASGIEQVLFKTPATDLGSMVAVTYTPPRQTTTPYTSVVDLQIGKRGSAYTAIHALNFHQIQQLHSKLGEVLHHHGMGLKPKAPVGQPNRQTAQGVLRELAENSPSDTIRLNAAELLLTS